MKKLFYISALLLSCLLLYSCDTNGNSAETTVAEQTVTAEETTVAEETTDSLTSITPEETSIEETTAGETTIAETTEEETTVEEIIITPNDSPRYSLYRVQGESPFGIDNGSAFSTPCYSMDDFYNLSYTDIQYTELMEKSEIQSILSDLIIDSVNEHYESQYTKEDIYNSISIDFFSNRLWKTADGNLVIFCRISCIGLDPVFTYSYISDYFLLVDNHAQGSYGVELDNIPDDRYKIYSYTPEEISTFVFVGEPKPKEMKLTKIDDAKACDYFEFPVMWKILENYFKEESGLNDYELRGSLVELEFDNILWSSDDGRYATTFILEMHWETIDGNIRVGYVPLMVIYDYSQAE